MKIGLTYNLRHPANDRGNAADRRRDAQAFHLPGDDHDEEFDSPATVEALANTLIALGHEVELLGDGELLLERLMRSPRPELVWNFAEGGVSGRAREARVPAVLEMLGIPYTGSDPLTLAVALDKDCAKRLVHSAGVATPAWTTFDGDLPAAMPAIERLQFPLIAKPAYEGSSKGILAASVLHDMESLQRVLQLLFEAYRQPVLVEEFIEGDELTVGLIGNQPGVEVLGAMRVTPLASSDQSFVYSLEMKRDWQRQLRYECPARLEPAETEAVHRAALACFTALGCRDVARVDFRLRGGVPYFLEVNPLPGMSPTSGDLVILAAKLGIDFATLTTRILEAALRRLGIAATTSVPVPEAIS